VTEFKTTFRYTSYAIFCFFFALSACANAHHELLQLGESTYPDLVLPGSKSNVSVDISKLPQVAQENYRNEYSAKQRDFQPFVRIDANEYFITDADSNSNSTNLWQQIRLNYGIEELDNSAVRKFEQYYSSRKDYLNRIFQRAALYLPYISEEIQRRGLPSELALLPIVESAFNPRAYSVKGAVGLWQFMPATARDYGLSRNWWYEGRRDIVRSTEAALDHLYYLKLIFNDWQLALAAYNAGEYKIKRAMQSNARKKRSTHYEYLKLKTETREYVPKLIALKNIIENPKKFNVELPALTTKLNFAVVDFPFQVDFRILANATGIDQTEIAMLNPAFRRKSTPPGGPYQLLIPSDKVHRVAAWKTQTLPSQAVASSAHVVLPGDTLSEIATHYGVRVRDLMSVNSLNTDVIRIGQTLRVPLSNTGIQARTLADQSETENPLIHEVQAGESIGLIAQIYSVSVPRLKSFNSLETDIVRVGQKLNIPFKLATGQFAGGSGNFLADKNQIIYRVQGGDSLWKIARLYKVRVTDILLWNGLNSDDYIRPRQQLILYVN